MKYLNSSKTCISILALIILLIFNSNLLKAQNNLKNTFDAGFISSKGLISTQFQRNLILINDYIDVYGNAGFAYTPGSNESEPGVSNRLTSTIGSGLAFNLNKFRLGAGGEYNKVINEKGKDVDTNYDFISINTYIGYVLGEAGIKLSYLPRLYTNQECEIDSKNGFGFTIFLEF